MNGAMKKSLSDIAVIAGGEVIKGGDAVIEGLTSIDNPKKGCLTFVADIALLPGLEDTEIGGVIIPDCDVEIEKPCIRVKNPKLAFSRVMRFFFPARQFEPGISESAVIDDTAEIGEGSRIEPFVVIGKNVKIGKNCVVRCGAFIDDNVEIGDNTLIHPNATLYFDVKIGSNTIIHSSVVIGSDGFGYVANECGEQEKIPQIGNVIIGDNVEIGSNCSVDRAAFGSTIISSGVKIDNLVQIAHNVFIGENTVISGLSGIAGSTKIGRNCTIAAAVGIGDHCVIEDGVIIAGKAGVPSKKVLKSGQVYIGAPARPIKKFMEQQGVLAKLPYLLRRFSK